MVIIDSEAVEHAFIYDNGVMADLGALNDGTSLAFGINDSGQVVGYSNDLAFLYENGSMQDLNLLLSASIGTSLSYASAINSSGQIIAYGSNGHSYLLNRDNISPIPEPQTYLMLLAGLGLLGFMAHRRKENALNLGTAVSTDWRLN
ncbi:MAG: FxDxF family PEP-CTERM protein [Bacteroidetes bacterium]|nr:FxDxF family PEP-CTERM protein [Bacteroidota bacterium]